MMRLAGLMGWTGVLAVVLASGCHKKETRYVFVGSAAPAPAPASVVEAPAPVVEAAPAEPVPVEPAPAPVVVAPAPVVVAPAPVVVAPAPAVSVSFFHTHLGHHGHWVTVASYGQVWVPSGVAVGWQPYTAGHWVFTDAYGWMWVSDEPWGWATYHYGRWAFVEPQGWVWVPGTVWGPAWVVWRSGGGYVGWAPMPPAVVVAEPRPAVEVNINIGLNVVEHIHPRHWVFVHEAHVLEPVHAHMVSVTNNITIINKTTHVTNVMASHGRIVDRSISVREVERVTGRPVRALRVREVETDAPSRTTVKKDEVVIERPRLRAASADGPARGQQTGAKPRGGADSATGQPARTRTQPAAQQPAGQPKPTTPTTPAPRSGASQGPERGKRTDATTKTQAGTTTVTPATPQTGKGEPNVRDRVRRPSGASQDNIAPVQPQQNTRNGAKDAPAAGDHYTKPFPPPTQPKVDPGPRRPRPAPSDVNPQGPGVAQQPGMTAPPQPRRSSNATSAGTPATDAPAAGSVRRSNVTPQPKTEPAGEVRQERGASTLKRVAPKQPAVEQPKPAPKPAEAVPANPAPSEKGTGDVQRDRSRAGKRVPGSTRDKPDESDVERENVGTRRG